MFIDTHGHLNTMVKERFDTILTLQEQAMIASILKEAEEQKVHYIINVGTSLVESKNCVLIAQTYNSVFAVVGIHPNDCTEAWSQDFADIKRLVKNKLAHKIVGIGECGIDRHYPNYNLMRQQDAFRAHIELALKEDLALVVHSRDAYDETLRILDEYTGDIERCVIHCFSYDQAFADHVIQYGFLLGIGGTITYPKNNDLRTIVQKIPPNLFVLETDAPFLPPQSLRGTKNHPKNISIIARFVSELRQETVETVGQQTTQNACKLFNLPCF